MMKKTAMIVILACASSAFAGDHPRKPVNPLRAFTLRLIFPDGYLGGNPTVAFFSTEVECRRRGADVSMRYNSYGHPSTYLCHRTPGYKRGDEYKPLR